MAITNAQQARQLQQDADSLVRDLDGLIEKLNSTFQQDLRDEQQRFTWFMSSGSKA